MRVRRSKTSRVEMKVDYLSLCYRGSDNPAFIWFCDFLSKASRLSCDYQSRALCLSDGTSATPHLVFMKDMASRGKGCIFFGSLLRTDARDREEGGIFTILFFV